MFFCQKGVLFYITIYPPFKFFLEAIQPSALYKEVH